MRRIILLSGPSGSGKTTVSKALQAREPEKYQTIRSVTTRHPREADEYYQFVSDEEFDRMREDKQFLETNDYMGNQCKYGTPLKAVQEALQSSDCILEIDVNGKDQVARHKEFKVTSFFLVADPQTLCDRLIFRGETNNSIIRRLKASMEEVVKSTGYDAVIINNDTDKTIIIIKSFIENRSMTAEDTFSMNDYIEEVEKVLRKLGSSLYEPR